VTTATFLKTCCVIPNMTALQSQPGHIVIKYNNEWGGTFYLSESLIFVPQLEDALRFSVFTSDNTAILNGDRIILQSGGQVLIVNNVGKLELRNYNQVTSRDVSSFIITDGSDTTENVEYDKSYFLAHDPQLRTGLKAEWDVNPLPPEGNHESYMQDESRRPRLVLRDYIGTSRENLSFYRFSLASFAEEARETHEPEVEITHSNTVEASPPSMTSSMNYWLKGWRGTILVSLLVIILVLSIALTS
jgi:hypothetical protein